LWAWFSDAVGWRTVFLMMFVLESAAFLLSQVDQFALLSLWAFLILPLLRRRRRIRHDAAFATEYFGVAQIRSIYGLRLTALGCAAALCPSLVAGIRQATGRYQSTIR
jgi:MFS transporter, OFA family, oxalate/formate antiporter